jgi:flagellar motor component MotA
MFPVVGLIVLIVLVFGGFALTGGNLEPVLHAMPHEMLIIGGAAVGALIIGNSGKDLKADLPRHTADEDAPHRRAGRGRAAYREPQ